MPVLQVLAFAAGAVIVVYTGSAALRTVVLPRASSTMINRVVFITMRKVFNVFAHEGRTYEQRDRVNAIYGPLCLVLLPFVWISLMIIGFTLMMWGLNVQPLRQAFILSGSSIFTLGFALPHDLPVDLLVFLEAMIGLGLVALLISYLPSIYGAFARREQLVGGLETRAGNPPSAGQLLSRYAQIGGMDMVDDELFRRWEQWFIDVEESHISFAALVYFRSPQPERSWITAAGCVLDTASVLLAAVDRPRSGHAQILIRTGYLCLRRLCDYFGIRYDPNPRPDDPISVTRREFDLVLVELEAAGVPLKPDRDQAWRDFAGWRVNYDRPLTSLAALVFAPPAPWSSDRGVVAPRPKLFRRSRRAA
ncbi:MAG TPA: hypothetical protein VK461_12930 [Acidimicrobiales bacterium]|nr:hypothetical protein [Acidimicrobiales bacterium]